MRRFVVVLMAILAIVGTAEWVAPTVVEAQSNPPLPWLRATPDCVPGSGTETTIRVRGSGFDPGSTVEIYFGLPRIGDGGPDIASIATVRTSALLRTAQSNEPLATVTVDRLGTFDQDIVVAPEARSGTYDVQASTVGRGPTAWTVVRSPCAETTLRIVTECKPAEGGTVPASITVRGKGFLPGDDRIKVWSPTDGATGVIDETVRADDNGEFSVEIPIGQLRPGTYEVRAVSAQDQNARAYFETPCPSMEIQVRPDCAPAGGPPDRMDVVVQASGFHPRSRVLIVWDSPRSHEAFETRTDEEGSFTLTISPYRRVAETYAVRVRTEADESAVRQRTVSFVVPCKPLEADVSVTECRRPAIEGEGERRWSIDIVASGFEPGDVTIVFDADEVVAARTFVLPADPSGVVDGTITPIAGPVGEYRILAVQSSTGQPTLSRVQPLRPITGEAIFRAPCRGRTPPPPTLEDACGPEAVGIEDAYDIVVNGTGFYPGGIVRIRFGRGAGSQETAARADDGSYEQLIRPDGRGENAYPVTITQRDSAGNLIAEARSDFTVPCSIDPSIAITPDHGPAGYTTLVEGTDFRPGTTVTLTWDSGIEADRPFEVTIEADGTFEIYLFILPNDWSGERTLTAGLPGGPGAFPGVTDEYFVVPGSGLPLGSDGDRIVGRR